MRVEIYYGLERAEYEVADANLVVPRREPRTPPIQDIGQAVTNALERPHGFPALRKALTPDDHVVIVVDNQLPHLDEMLTAVVEYLIQARIRAAAITLLYASSPSTGVNGQLPGHPEIAVETHDGVVTLTGVVPTEREKQAARQQSKDAGDNRADVTNQTEQRQKQRELREKLQRVVFIKTGDKVRMQKVETGIADSTHIEIKSGIRPGDEVVSGSYTAISRKLKDGAKVEIEKVGKG